MIFNSRLLVGGSNGCLLVCANDSVASREYVNLYTKFDNKACEELCISN